MELAVSSKSRIWLASLFSFVAAAAAFFIPEALEISLGIPTMLFVVGGLLLHVQTPVMQMLGRSALWTSVVFQLFLAHAWFQSAQQSTHEFSCLFLATPVIAVVAGCVALLLAGHNGLQGGLQGESKHFKPVAHRGILTTALVLAMADTLSLLLWASIAFFASNMGIIPFALAGCAGLMLVGVVGLFRLKTWGLIVNLVSNLFVAWLTWFEIIDIGELKLVFVTTAIFQLIVPLPLIYTIVTGKPIPTPPWLKRASAWVSTGVLLTVIALAVQPMFGKSVLLIIAGWVLPGTQGWE